MVKRKVDFIVCKKCGNEWQPRTTNPKCCPKCKNYKYMEKKSITLQDTKRSEIENK